MKLKPAQLKTASNLCVLPWIGLEVRSNGTRSCCCLCRSSIAPGDSREQSPELRALKKRFLAGERPKECSACWALEERGALSQRQELLSSHADAAGEILRAANSDLPVRILYLKVGNICNQKCLICEPSASSLWISEPKFAELSSRQDWQQVVSNDFEKYRDAIRDADTIYLAGGEPLMSAKPLRQLSAILGGEDCGKKNKLSIITNGSFAADLSTLQELRKYFGKVGVFMSADGTFAQFNYQRFPGDWGVFFQNYESLRATEFFGGIGITLSSLNIFYVAEYLKFWEEQNEFRVYFNFLTDPAMLSITRLPRALLLAAREKLLRSPPKSHQMQRLLQPLLAYIQSLLAESGRETDVEGMCSYLEFYDRHRKTSFAENFPEYAGLISLTEIGHASIISP